MGRYVEIKKIKEEGVAYYYSVQSPDYAEVPPVLRPIDRAIGTLPVLRIKLRRAVGYGLPGVALERSLGGLPLFYITINALEQIVAFYKNLSDRKAELIVHMGRDIDRSPDWLPSFLVYATLKKAWEAVKNYKFDLFISFQS